MRVYLYILLVFIYIVFRDTILRNDIALGKASSSNFPPFFSPSFTSLLGQCEHDAYVSNILSTTAKFRMFEVLVFVGSVWTQCKVITDIAAEITALRYKYLGL